MLRRNPQCDGLGGGGFERRLDHEGSALMNGKTVLIKETPERAPAFSAI